MCLGRIHATEHCSPKYPRMTVMIAHKIDGLVVKLLGSERTYFDCYKLLLVVVIRRVFS